MCSRNDDPTGWDDNTDCRHGQNKYRHAMHPDGTQTDEGTFYTCDCCGTSILCHTPGRQLVIVLCAGCNKGREIS